MENRLVMFVGAQGEETLSFGISTEESEDSYRVTAAQKLFSLTNLRKIQTDKQLKRNKAILEKRMKNAK